jgi:hypothetical protein
MRLEQRVHHSPVENGTRSSMLSPVPTHRIGSEIVRDRHRDAALGGAIELGQHDAGDASRGGELARLRDAVLSHRRVEHEERFVRRARDLARGDAADLLELAHQVGARVQAAGSVDQDRIAAARAPGLERVEDHGGRIGSALRADHVDAGPVRPDLELLDRRGAERVGRTHQRILALRLQRPRQLSTVVVLPVPLTPTIITTRAAPRPAAAAPRRRGSS